MEPRQTANQALESIFSCIHCIIQQIIIIFSSYSYQHISCNTTEATETTTSQFQSEETKWEQQTGWEAKESRPKFHIMHMQSLTPVKDFLKNLILLTLVCLFNLLSVKKQQWARGSCNMCSHRNDHN